MCVSLHYLCFFVDVRLIRHQLIGKKFTKKIDNDDREAYRFFFPEYLKERSKNLHIKHLED
jgi:hypothetical protein